MCFLFFRSCQNLSICNTEHAYHRFQNIAAIFSADFESCSSLITQRILMADMAWRYRTAINVKWVPRWPFNSAAFSKPLISTIEFAGNQCKDKGCTPNVPQVYEWLFLRRACLVMIRWMPEASKNNNQTTKHDWGIISPKTRCPISYTD